MGVKDEGGQGGETPWPDKPKTLTMEKLRKTKKKENLIGQRLEGTVGRGDYS